jgi:hypothetical protein
MKRSPQLRKAATLSESVHQRLNAYALAASAAGVGLLAMAQPAEARIVYTHAHKVIGSGETYTLDLNHDGKIDFVINNIATHCDTDNCFRSLSISAKIGDAVQGIQRLAYSAFALSAGAQIDSRNLLFRGAALAEVNVPGGTSCLIGYWCNFKNRFLGLALNIKGRMHYGWARLSVTTTQTVMKATLTGYAFETIPNKPIIAGKTHGKDDMAVRPASLGALAAGSSALSTWRHNQGAGK